jgi:8-oxo-dGTP pyrophosphatase MutT (NUDIX family)
METELLQSNHGEIESTYIYESHDQQQQQQHITCNNCGKYGHIYNQCKLPKLSYGIIVFRFNQTNTLEYLMVRRKYTFGYTDFLTGKYDTTDIHVIKNIIGEMSFNERNKINTQTFDELWSDWNDNWGNDKEKPYYKNMGFMSKTKHEALKKGVCFDIETSDPLTLNNIITDSLTSWDEPEWEFPKGKRNLNESDLDCALREFEEETGISKHKIRLIENVLPFEEIFLGTDGKSYKYKYFLAFMDTNQSDCPMDQFQKSEVSKMEWKTIDQCLTSIRPYNLEKKELILNVNNALLEYRLYL